MTIRDIIHQEIQDLINDWGDLVYIGKTTGEVTVSGKPGKIYVTSPNGSVSEVWNSSVPNIPGHPAYVKMVKGSLEVTRLKSSAFSDYHYPNVGPHSALQEWGQAGADLLHVWPAAIMAWRAWPIAGTLTFTLFHQVFNGTVWVDESQETVDLTSHVPTSNSRWVLVSINSSGTTVLTDGTALATPAITDIPALPAGNKALWAIRLTVGQTNLTDTPAISSFKDLRWSGEEGGGSGGGDMLKSTYDTNDDGIVDEAAALSGISIVTSLGNPGTDGNVVTEKGVRTALAGIGGGTGGAPDASNVTYTPMTLADWDSSTDPGNMDNATDQLAARVKELEGEVPGGGDVAGPATNHADYIPQWNGTNSKTLKDGFPLVTTIGSTGADTNLPSERAVREAISAILASSYYSTCFVHFHEGIVTAGSCTLTTTFNASQILAFYGNTVAPIANGDEVSFYVPLKAGTYAFECWFTKNTNRGKVDIYLDGATFVTGIDLYAASATYNSVTNVTGLTVTGDGLHTITFKMNGKNGSSATPYYVLSFTYFTMKRTGA